MQYNNKIYFGSIILEKNRWSTRKPSYLVSEWLEKIAKAGFDGIELWENHALMPSGEERRKLKDSPVPVTIFNSYANCDDTGNTDRQTAVDMVTYFNAEGMKFNTGTDSTRHEEYIRNAEEWRKMLPSSFRFLCECHGKTTMETPEAAEKVIKKFGTGNIHAIIHAFTGDDKDIIQWFKHLGKSITHVHVQMASKDNKRIRLSSEPNAVKERLALLKESGFNGSFTTEFTEGVAEPGEDINAIFENARDDMEFLRDNLT